MKDNLLKDLVSTLSIDILNNHLMDKKIKFHKVAAMYGYLKDYNDNLITFNEALKLISNI